MHRKIILVGIAAIIGCAITNAAYAMQNPELEKIRLECVRTYKKNGRTYDLRGVSDRERELCEALNRWTVSGRGEDTFGELLVAWKTSRNAHNNTLQQPVNSKENEVKGQPEQQQPIQNHAEEFTQAAIKNAIKNHANLETIGRRFGPNGDLRQLAQQEFPSELAGLDDVLLAAANPTAGALIKKELDLRMATLWFKLVGVKAHNDRKNGIISAAGAQAMNDAAQESFDALTQEIATRGQKQGEPDKTDVSNTPPAAPSTFLAKTKTFMRDHKKMIIAGAAVSAIGVIWWYIQNQADESDVKAIKS